MDNRPIGIFDSGIGGLTVLDELQINLPNENYIYLGDNLNFPYGEKTKEEIILLSKKNIDFLINKNVKLIVIACGTATSQALDEMKKLYDIPIIGIIEPTADYVKKLNLSKIGVTATNGTIRSRVWEKKIKEKNSKIEVINQACPLLANIAEEGKCETEEGKRQIHNYMEIFKKNNVENIILGCTHFPIFDEIIRKEFNGNINLINTGKPIAQYLKKFLKDNNIENLSEEQDVKIILTKNERNFDKKAKKILKSAKKLDITKFY